MRTSCSRPVPAGHLVILVSDSEGAAVLARFTDDGSVRDLTSFAADLVLMGLTAEVESGAAPPPAETAQVAVLELSGTWQGWYVHHPSGTVAPVDETTLVRLASLGAAGAITASVAERLAAELPDTSAPFGA